MSSPFTRITPAVVLGTLLLVGLAGWGIWHSTETSQAAPAAEQRLLTFSGSGTAEIAPDGASITAGVTAVGRSADEAQDRASRKMRRLLDHMQGLGISDEQLETTEASVYEDWEDEGRFRASQSLEITVEDPARAGKLLGEATQGGADTVSGPAFALDDQRAGYDEALRSALADARAKADAAAAQMEARVLAVYAIGESNGEGGVPMYAEAAATTARDAAVDVPVEPGTQSVTMTVDVSFTYER
jgi:uncharacterized protein